MGDPRSGILVRPRDEVKPVAEHSLAFPAVALEDLNEGGRVFFARPCDNSAGRLAHTQGGSC